MAFKASFCRILYAFQDLGVKSFTRGDDPFISLQSLRCSQSRSTAFGRLVHQIVQLLCRT